MYIWIIMHLINLIISFDKSNTKKSIHPEQPTSNDQIYF